MLNLNEDAYLNQKGYKRRTESTLKSYSKKDLIDIIRCLEHNWAGEIWGNNLLSKRLQNVSEYLQQSHSLKEINKIMSIEGENL